MTKKTCGVGGLNCLQLLMGGVLEKSEKPLYRIIKIFISGEPKWRALQQGLVWKDPPSLAHCATVYLHFDFLFPSAIPFSIYPWSIQRGPDCIFIYYIYLRPSSISCKVKEMNVSPGKILGSSVYSLKAFTAITSPGQVRAILFSPPSLLDTCPSFFFLFLRLYWNSRPCDRF